MRWSQEMIDYLKLVAPQNTIVEIATKMNQKFNTELTSRQIETAKYRNGIKSYKERGHYRLIFTNEIKMFILDNHDGVPIKDMAKKINKKFNTDFDVTQIQNFYTDHEIKSNTNTKFGSGENHPYSKPLGYEYKDSRSRTWVKTSMKGKNKYRLKSHLVWEETHGKIKKGHVLMYLDRNPSNYHLENLTSVSTSLRGKLAKADFTSDPLINQSIIGVERLQETIKSKESDR